MMVQHAGKLTSECDHVSSLSEDIIIISHTHTHTTKLLIIHTCINIFYLNYLHKLKRNDQALLDLKHAPITLQIIKLLSNQVA